MQFTLSDSEAATIRKVQRSLAIWRYRRWAQLILGPFLMWYGLHLLRGVPNPARHMELLLPIVVVFLGSSLFSETVREWSSKERSLLLKLYRAQSPDAA
jgi:hypothetical protein